YAERRVPIGGETTAAELRTELVAIGSELLVDTLSSPLSDWIDAPQPQEGEPIYAAKLDKAEFEIDWDDPIEHIHRLIRVGGAWTTFRGKRLKINQARVVDGGLVPVAVQPEGKAAIPFDAWRNGAQPRDDELFADS
ncbi:MAG: hypothetical protein AAFP84_20855, partial [Actinomycetota bacterium]